MSITLNGTTGIIADSPATVKANTYLDAAGGNTATINGAVPASLASPALTGTPTAPTATVGTNTTQIATTAFVAASQAAGEVSFFAMSSAPTGWLKANGAAISRTTYATLFTAIGTTFGVGDGSTTFNVPDLRGEFARGWDDGRGIDSGRAFGSAQTDQFQGHGHTLTGRQHAAGSGTANEFADTGAAEVYSNTTSVQDPVARSNGTPRTGNETRPRNIALLACIKY